MTIAAGFVCSDGIVMCADSQETYADLKWPVQKLQVEGWGYPIMITGAGFGAAIDSATQRIREKLRGGYDQETALKHIVAILRDIDEDRKSVV